MPYTTSTSLEVEYDVFAASYSYSTLDLADNLPDPTQVRVRWQVSSVTRVSGWSYGPRVEP